MRILCAEPDSRAAEPIRYLQLGGFSALTGRFACRAQRNWFPVQTVLRWGAEAELCDALSRHCGDRHICRRSRGAAVPGEPVLPYLSGLDSRHDSPQQPLPIELGCNLERPGTAARWLRARRRTSAEEPYLHRSARTAPDCRRPAPLAWFWAARKSRTAGDRSDAALNRGVLLCTHNRGDPDRHAGRRR